MSIGFLLLFLSFNSAANMSPKAMADDDMGNLGFYSMACMYLVYAILSFISTPLVNKLGIRASLVIGSLSYFFWVLCFLFPAFA
jgi:hypothetical protein